MSTFDIQINGTEVALSRRDGRVVVYRLPHPVTKVHAEHELNRVFVITDPPVDDSRAANLFCFDLDSGIELWQKVADKSRSTSNVFTELKFKKNPSSLTVWDWDGYRSILNPETGQVQESHFFK